MTITKEPPTPVYVTGYEARDRFGIPLHRTHQWSHHGRVRPVRYAGRSPVFDLSDLIRLNDAANANPLAKHGRRA